mmetsp:Transcript_31776/g.69812  ORF Transcript_31776/g.69812 Transcript_31776/m.69812 type:complete len:385 (-) Transcript_31776:1293-2447(-)
MRLPRYSALTAATSALIGTGRLTSARSAVAPFSAFSATLPSTVHRSAPLGAGTVLPVSPSFRRGVPGSRNQDHLPTSTHQLRMASTDAAAASSTGETGQVRTIESDGGEVQMTVHHLPSVGSTQDEARRILGDISNSSSNTEQVASKRHACLATSASEQTKGRGTSGRDWIGKGGNTFVTVCVPSDCIVNIPVTLLPLKVGSIVAKLVHDRLRSQKAWARVAVKWPNDVLVDDKKIAGILIESHYDETTRKSWYLIGVGVNVAHAPTIDLVGPQRGRMSTCLASHCDIDGDGVENAREMAFDVAKGIHEWIAAAVSGGELVDKSIASDAIIREWSDWAEFGKEQVLRDKPGNEIVTPLGIEADGRLRVRGRNGREMLLAADYLL